MTADGVEVRGPGLDIDVVVDGEADRVETATALDGGVVDPQGDLGVAEAGNGAGNASDGAVGVGELRRDGEA